MTSKPANKMMSREDAQLVKTVLTSGLIPVPGRGVRAKNTATLRHGKKLRDEWMWQFPILPGAVMTFIQAAVSREWTVTGTPRRAARAVETLNSARFMDYTGEIHYGWQALQTRRAMDWLTLGMTAMVYPRTRGGGRGYLQYVDPTELIKIGMVPQFSERILRKKTKPLMTNYQYLNKKWRSDELVMNYPMPTGGAGLFGSPLLGILASARLAYLIREHDQAKADGRKIRDIFIVQGEDMRESLWNAIITNLKTWNGGSVTELGIPIVDAGGAGGLSEKADVSKMFARLGLADIPDNLDRSAFFLDYANEIASMLGIPLRTFWNDPRGSNRSLEKVTNERARRVGPSYYILSEERHINNIGFLGDRVRFQFIEEVDTGLLKDRAEIAHVYAQAVEKLKISIPHLSGTALINWLQELLVLPNDADLLDEIVTLSEDPVQASDMVDGDIEQMLAEQADAAREQEIDASIEAQEAQFELQEQYATPSPENTEENKQAAVREFKQEVGYIAEYLRSTRHETPLEVGMVRLDREQNIIESRSRVFHVSGLLALEKAIYDEVEYISHETYEDQVGDLVEAAFS